MSECYCSMSTVVLGDGCRYCQPQTYIDKLSEIIDDERSEHETELAEVKAELALALKVPSVAAIHSWLDSEFAKEIKRLGDEIAALKSAPVVMPSEQHLREILDDLEDDDGCSRDDVSYGFRMAIGLITRLNRSKTNEQ